MFKAKYTLSILALGLLFFNFGCDNINSVPLNIPFRIPFSVTGSGTTYNTGLYQLDKQSDTYSQYQDKIKSLSYVQSSLTFTGISDTTVTADITIKVMDENNATIFTYNVTNFRPADYVNKSYVITLTQNQIIAFNNYLNNLSSNSFQASITVSGISGTQTLSGNVDLVLEADTKL